MVLVIVLTVASIAGISYGIVKKSKPSIVGATALLVFLIISLLVYAYLYSKNPY